MKDTIKALLKDWLREPLAHFLIAGFAVFLIASWRGDPVDPSSRTITIDAAQVSRLAESWARTWQRPPNPNEIDGLIRDYIKEEVYYREAKRAGLDDGDFVIRRRLRSKMEFLASEVSESVQADDTVLQKWLDDRPARYARGTAISFDQIYLKEDVSGAKPLIAQLAAGADWKSAGAAITLPASLERATSDEIVRQFGDSFAQSLIAMKPGSWTGPVASGFGQHLVRIRAVQIPPPPKLADVRQQVENDWRAETTKAREAAAYQALLDSYTIKIAKP